MKRTAGAARGLRAVAFGAAMAICVGAGGVMSAAGATRAAPGGAPLLGTAASAGAVAPDRLAPLPVAAPERSVPRDDGAAETVDPTGTAGVMEGLDAAATNQPPPTPVPVAPADNAIVATTTPTLKVTSVIDPDGQSVVYAFRVATNPDGSGGFVHSVQSTPSFTVPADRLRNGTTYYWQAIASDGQSFSPAWTPLRSFFVDLRLGSANPAPRQRIGPVEVNLSTGDLTLATSTPTFQTVGGPLGLTLTYDSLGESGAGLIGRYFVDVDADGVFDATDTLWIQRTDRQVAFDWASGGPESLAGDGFLARWTGSVRVPTAGSWQFGVRAAGGARVKVGSTTVLDAWAERTAPATAAYGTAVSLQAGIASAITVEYAERSGPASIELWARGPGFEDVVPPGWLANADRGLPAGWEMAAGRGAGWVRARRNDASITLFDTSGTPVEFLRQGTGATASYRTPLGHSDTVSVNAAGEVLVSGADGVSSLFRADGQLASALSGSDDSAPAAPAYRWETVGTTGLVRLTAMTDPVSHRDMIFTYQGGSTACPAASGFTTPPVGMLCGVAWWDGTATQVLYTQGRLARIVEPGSVVTDFGYDAQGRVTTMRDPATMDAVAAGVVADDTTTRVEITYGADGRVSQVLPPSANGYRPTTSFTYAAGETRVQLSGAQQPFGFTRRVTLDDGGRPLTDTDATNRTTTSTWSRQDRLLISDDPAGLRTANSYDGAGQLTRTSGPAPLSCFDGGTPNGSCAVPTVRNWYDQGIWGLAATYWRNRSLTGPPGLHDTATGDSSGNFSLDWGSGAPAGLGAPSGDDWSGRFTGSIHLSERGSYNLVVAATDGVRLWVDDVLLIDQWTAGDHLALGTFLNPIAGLDRRIRLEYFEATGPAQVALYWQRPSDPTNTVLVPTRSLAPGYELLGQTTDADGRTTSYAYGSWSGTGVGPEHHLLTDTILDPTGLNLGEANVFEPPGTGFMRRTEHRLPSGQRWVSAYYGAAETRDNPCTTATDPAPQAGLLKTTTGPDPDGAGPQTARVDETVYDQDGRAVARRVGIEPWTCTAYDARGRVTSVQYPAFGGQPARTVTYGYAVGGDPLHTSVSDPTGTVEGMVDLQGRTVLHRDVWGTVTLTGYDAAGQLGTIVNAQGHVDYVYDAAGRVTQASTEQGVVARVTYDAGGRPSQVTYPGDDGSSSNGTEVGNGTRSAPFTYDGQGRLTGLRWETAAGQLITSDQRTLGPGGDLIDEVVDQVDPHPDATNFSYDGAGRLTDAWVPGAHYTYEFAQNTSCPQPDAYRNSDRTRMTATPTGGTAVTTGYCYDTTDRLTSATDAAVGSIGYDAHGNTTAIFGESRAYDAADRHVQTAHGPTLVRYARDAMDRIVERSLNGTVAARYGSTSAGDTVDYTMDGAGTVVERAIPLPGGVTLTWRPGGASTWSYPNLHADLVAGANASGAKLGATAVYDPFGGLLSGSVPDNVSGAFDYGWLGQYQRPLEHESGLEPVIEMGARQYSTRLGRFLEVDPIEGGSANPYDYAYARPTTLSDTTGTLPLWTCIQHLLIATQVCHSRWGRCIGFWLCKVAFYICMVRAQNGFWVCLRAGATYCPVF